jgi:hypothetical protein
MENAENKVVEKQFGIFRNSGRRIYYLKARPHQQTSEKTFAVGPGQTVQAMDAEEETMLGRMFEFVDINKETPQIATAIENLNKELAEARAENARLKAAQAAPVEKPVEQVPAIAEPVKQEKRKYNRKK